MPGDRGRVPKLIDVDNLFETAVTVFAEHGYQATTTQEIASRAGVSEVTLFRRHGTKAALIEAALTHCLAESPFAHVVATEDVHDDLVAIVEAYEATRRAYGGAVMTLLVEAPRQPELRNAVGVLVPNLENAAHIIATHQTRGRIGAGDPLHLVAFLLAPLMMGGLWARLGTGIPSEFDPVAVVDAFLDGHRPG